ncbi:FMN-binding protein [bacterium]|nr:FMN-binding protein [bacterium]
MLAKIKMVIFVLILGSILTTALVLVNNYTDPIIAKNAVLKVKRSVLLAFEIPYSEENVEQVFDENITSVEKGGKEFFINTAGEVCFEFSGSGVWGPIEGVAALNPDLETIKGITIVQQEETPGLGSRIGDKDYLDTFKGKKIIPDFKILPPGKASAENEVDGITGATLSCNAFSAILNNQFSKFVPLYKGSE